MTGARVGEVLAGFALVLVAAGCGNPAASPLAPKTYLDHALLLMQEDAAAAPSVDWAAVDRKAHEMAAGAKTAGQTYPAIEYAVSQLQRAGDGHATFFDPLVARMGGASTRLSRVHSLPSVTRVGRLAEVTLPGFQVAFDSAVGRRYLTSALTDIAVMERTHHPCGWIVNLDGDDGGNGWAMLLSVGPLVGQGRLFGLTGRHGFRGWVSYGAGVIHGVGISFRAPVRVPPITPAPPIAVLTSHDTVSGGELVTVGLRGRPMTESFGSATGGATNGPQAFRLADGAELFFGVSYFVDRDGAVYRHPIRPTVTAYLDQAAATKWLLHTPACKDAAGAE